MGGLDVEAMNEKTIIVAVKAFSEQELGWFTVDALKRALEATLTHPYTVPHESVRMRVEEHSCPKLAVGSVDAAFQRIDKLEARLVDLVEHLMAKMVEKIKPKHTF